MFFKYPRLLIFFPNLLQGVNVCVKYIWYISGMIQEVHHSFISKLLSTKDSSKWINIHLLLMQSDNHSRRSTKERHRNPAPYIWKVGYRYSQLVFSLLLPCRLQPSISEHWNHLGSFKSPQAQIATPRGFSIIGLGWSLGTGVLKSSPSLRNVQPRLKSAIAGTCSQTILPFLTRWFFTAI